MFRFPGTVTGLRVRQGGSYARGTTIDAYLSPEDCAALYNFWKSSWPEPLAFPGNIQAITCEMVLAVPEEEFVDYLSASAEQKRTGRALAFRIREAALRNAGR